MKRATKNLLNISSILILCLLIFFTMFFAKNLVSAPRRNFPGNNMQFQMRPSQSSNREQFDNNQRRFPREPQNQQDKTINDPPQFPEGNMEMPPNRNFREDFKTPNILTISLPLYYYIILGIENLLLSLLIIYLIMSNLNKKTLQETIAYSDKKIIFVLSVVILTTIFTLLTSSITSKVFTQSKNFLHSFEEDDDEVIIDVDSGVLITDSSINLNDYSTNITINKTGNYTLTGTSTNSVLVDADGDVTLILDNVNINSQITSAIANIDKNKLTIVLADNSTNELKDNGESQYDGCIFSYGPLVIEGNGTLNITGNQNDGEGIATDTNDITINGGNINITSNDDGINAGGDGGTITINNGNIYVKASGDGIDSNKDIIINGGKLYTIGSALGGDSGIDADGNFIINGGEIIALGSDMLLPPNTSSLRKSISVTLPQVVQSGSELILKNQNNEIITTFTANENFRTLILSTDKLVNGKYILYKNNNEIITDIIL